MRLIIRDIEEDATTLHSPRMDGMPGGTPGDAMANYVMRREAAIRDYERKARELEGIRKEIERAIAQQDEKARVVLRYRYICGYSWSRIAREMCYSVPRVKGIHALFCGCAGRHHSFGLRGSRHAAAVETSAAARGGTGGMSIWGG